MNKIKTWLKRRRELKQLEKGMDKKIAEQGMDYMFENAKTYGNYTIDENSKSYSQGY